MLLRNCIPVPATDRMANGRVAPAHHADPPTWVSLTCLSLMNARPRRLIDLVLRQLPLWKALAGSLAFLPTPGQRTIRLFLPDVDSYIRERSRAHPRFLHG
ncbi:hypothetical protein HBI56_194870 [Parastagonospora nodorum]|uniref:Uncharacterized protein n=1 Tax=Phaeosphaeria nodorum (strain SN15 / ATCC MYA-4574 / FGSC 10173) TaxID=321614 RepID=A0A7U2HXV6_PHANO|nr:hypothetical protein HBH56_206540 [Parastagonospora nodorum]QRC94693.1 hypothetical protein JI435_406180 [Parastagonospora nodorum SN15]KAH3923816.1 hypothetical protein HBH54_205410 [Parastagonospora nodorum]KAH3942238.1 hypothetical protein HBH53_188950 [Parastagonospora nodorum]KAH3962252.1 hypothetical protein HBH51_176830 [Parastagonospora nodorum]